MKILAINWQDISHPLGGGAEVHLHEVFKRIAAQGHHVTLLCSKYPGAKKDEIIDGIQIVRVGNRPFFNFFVPYWSRKLIAQKKIDIVIDDINKIPFFTPLFIQQPILGIIHHLFGKSIYAEINFIMATYVWLAELWIPRVYQNISIVVASFSTRSELIVKGMSNKRINLVNYAVDHAVFNRKKSKKSEIPLVGYFGRLKRYKSIQHLILAFCDVVKQVPAARLVIIGDGDYAEQLKRLIVNLNLEKTVIMTGHVSEDEKISWINKMWVHVNPSIKEGWGLTVIEANACGVPVIAADSPGLRDAITEGENGWLYEYGNVPMLVEKLLPILSQNQLREAFTPKCIHYAEKFDWDVAAREYFEIIQHRVGGIKES